MFAALITGLNKVEMVEFPDPTPAPNGVVVDIAFCGICGTDIHAYQSGNPYNPAICGHEWSGTLSAVGSDVQSFSEGDRVVVAVAPACGQCVPCRAGQANRCMVSLLSALGRDAMAPKHGGFAPRIAVDAMRIVKTNPLLNDAQAALVEPTTVAFHAVRRSGIRLGDIAVIQGAGPIGLGAMQWVKAAGAGVVIVVEPNGQRRALATELGAHHVVVPGADADRLVKELSHGLGADIVYECVGRSFAVQSAVDLARRGGSMCLIGLADQDAPITPVTWLMKELSVSSALAYNHEEFEMCMGMIADGRFRTEPLHSLTIGLDGLDGALADLASGTSVHTKILVDPRM